MIIRFADILLWKAEALIETNQNLDEARTLINRIRQRAQNSTYVKTLDGSADAANYKIGLYSTDGWNQDFARKALRFERRLEFAMEGHRFFDLVRWGDAAQTINDYYQSEASDVSYLTGSQFIAGKHEFLPIPQSEIDLAPAIYKQNDNY
jgi:starch-binding outer membrane protein, SusD/RagB family